MTPSRLMPYRWQRPRTWRALIVQAETRKFIDQQKKLAEVASNWRVICEIMPVAAPTASSLIVASPVLLQWLRLLTRSFGGLPRLVRCKNLAGPSSWVESCSRDVGRLTARAHHQLFSNAHIMKVDCLENHSCP